MVPENSDSRDGWRPPERVGSPSSIPAPHAFPILILPEIRFVEAGRF